MLPLSNSLIKLYNYIDTSWEAIIFNALYALFNTNNHYLSILTTHDYLPTKKRLFSAFTQPLNAVRYVLIGESPYPRPESAIGLCFIDGAIDLLWSKNGLSKKVNKATSLRNFIKMLLVAEKKIDTNNINNTLAIFANEALNNQNSIIQTLTDLKNNLFAQGFLLLNASLIFRGNTTKVKDAKAWKPFLQIIFQALIEHAKIFKKKHLHLSF